MKILSFIIHKGRYLLEQKFNCLVLVYLQFWREDGVGCQHGSALAECLDPVLYTDAHIRSLKAVCVMSGIQPSPRPDKQKFESGNKLTS